MAAAVVAGEWRRAQECLAAAVLCRDNGLYADAVSRAYYAVMHAAKAALAQRDVITTSHRGVQRLFGKDLVMENRIEPVWADYISRGYGERDNADYDVSVIFTAADAQDACDRAADFLNRIRSLLGSAVVPAG